MTLEPHTHHPQPATPHSQPTTWLANLVVGLLLLAGFHLVLALGLSCPAWNWNSRAPELA
ncbi:MAG: hypothetical protein ACKPEY_04770 [Planctomycetota bacterium]